MTATSYSPTLVFFKKIPSLCCWLLAVGVLLSGLPEAGAKPLSAAEAPPGWTINPAAYQFSMNIILRVRYENVPSNNPNNLVGVFVGSELRGFAASTTIGGQQYYYITVYSNEYTGDILQFRAYYAPDDKVYATQETIPFYYHQSSVGTINQPFWININPSQDFAPEILSIPADTTLQNIPFGPLNLNDYLLSLDGDPVTWSAVPGANLTASVVNGILNVQAASPGWTGTDLVTITVTENTPNHYLFTRVASFTVLPDYGPPVLQPVPPQSIFPGGAFAAFDLDNYLNFNGPCRMFDFEVFPYSGTAADPAWPVVPAGPQAMSVVARPLFADQALAGPGAKLAAFVNKILVGTADPLGVPPNVVYPMSLQNLAAGPIVFRFYHAENQFLYEKTTKLNFVPGGSAGTVAAPLAVQLAPLVPALAANGTVTVAIADPDWRGTFPVNFIVWDCDFPLLRRDTSATFFSVTDDNRPEITSPAAVNFQENACAVLYDAQAVDPSDAEGSGLSYALAGGADAARFAIDPATGALSWFGFNPDFENPGDVNTDNQYEVILRVTNTLNISDELDLVVTVTDGPEGVFQPQINGGAAAACLQGSVALQASGGGTYLWSTGSTDALITVSLTGVYTVTVTNSGACTATSTVLVSPKPSATASAGAGPVCTGSSIQLVANASGGTGVFSQFAWAGPNSYVASGQQPASFPALAPASGVYTVTVTDDAGCTATATTTVSVLGGTAPAIVANNNGPLCAGLNLQLSSTPSGGSGSYTKFQWSGPSTFGSAAQNPLVPVALAAMSGTYTVTVTDNAGCTASGTTSVLVKPRPLIAAQSNSPLCTGGTVVLNSSPTGGSGSGYTFLWAGPNNYSATQEDPAGFPATLAGSGIYTVTVTDGAGCTASSTAAVSVNGLPTITAALVGPVCTGGSVGLLSAPAGGSGTYSAFQWSGPNSYSATQEDPPAFPVTPAVAGTYTVTVTDLAGCTATATTSVAVHPVPAITASNNGPVCDGSSLLLSSSPTGGSGVFSLFNWTGPDNYVATVEDPAAFSTTSASIGIYQVKVTDSQGCSATATTTVAIISKPTLTATSNSPVCLNGNIDLKTNPGGGSGTYSMYTWTGPDGFSAAQQNPAAFVATLLKAGTYRVTVSDNIGCTATASTTVAVSTNGAPSISATSNSPVCAGSNLILQSTPGGGSGTYLAFKWAGPNSYSATQEDPAALLATAAAAGVYTVTVTDSKSCAGTASVTVVVNAPTVSPSTNTPICVGSTVFLSAGPAGGTGVYTGFAWAGPGGYSAAVQNPPGFTAGPASVGTYTVTVTDNAGCTGTGTVAVSLQNNAPPTITCPADQLIPANGSCQSTLGNWVSSATNVSDDCTAPGNILVTQMPAASTLMTGHNSAQTVTLTADDVTGNTSACTFKVTLRDQSPPTITCPANQTVAADLACSGEVGNRVVQASNLSDNCAASVSVTQLPAANTPLVGHNTQVSVTLTASDGNGNTAACAFTVQLKDITPPTITCPGDQTVAADAACAGVVGNRIGLATNVSDNCTMPVPVTQVPAATTVLSGHNDEEIVTLSANDGNGNTTPCSFKVILKDITPPNITCPGPVTVSCLGNFPAANTNLVTATDNCSPVVKTHVGDTPPYNVTCINRFKVDRTYRASDAVGNSATCSQIITVFDNTLPTFTAVPANVTVQCSAVPAVGNASATDNCGGGVTVAYNGQTVTNIICTDTYTLTRQWTATDACGNTRTATQRITVRDTQLPVFTSVPAHVTVQCDAIPAVGNPTATDNCDTSVSISYNGETRTNGACLDTYVLTRKWTAVDNCGNTRSATQRVSVRDTQKPVFTSVPQNLTMECSATLPLVGTATATDNCDLSVSVVYLGESTANATCENSYQVLRVWLATDNCGNSTAATQTITVQDTQKPAFTSVPAPVTVQCSDLIPPIGTPTATDACASFVQITFLGQVRTDGSCLYNYTLTRTWQAQDLCGNATSASQIITVQDTQAPTFNNPPANVTVACANIPTAPVLSAQDNCSGATVVYQGQVQGPGTCATGYTLTRSWTATDGCGNAATHTQTILVQDQFAGDVPEGIAAGDPSGQGSNTVNRPQSLLVQRDFGLRPNPATDWITLDLQDFEGETLHIAVYSPLGALVWSQDLGADHEAVLRVNLRASGELPDGLFQVLLKTADAQYVKRFVLVR
ncbi:MAG: HYR domain-containing protein [Saprospiraceae bacterium]|nr:HYR domain-containing protein [Saprospiraceae bacterium]